MKKSNTAAGIIVRTYMIGALMLLTFYGAISYIFALYTEDMNSQRRLAVIGQYYLDMHREAKSNEVKIDPVLTIYRDYHSLPMLLKREIAPDWIGNSTFENSVEGNTQYDNLEYNVLAQRMLVDGKQKTLYAVENIELFEMNDIDMMLMQFATLGGGLLLFVIAATYIVKSAKQISEPLSNLSGQLEQQDEEFLPLTVSGRLPDELLQMLSAINQYRLKISRAFEGEKAFTRYISHELHTPMTVIKGSVSILRKSSDEKTLKQAGLISESLIEMEQLTQTFLQLAREEVALDRVAVNDELIARLINNHTDQVIANNVGLHSEVLSPFVLKAHPILFSAVLNNILKNAINCSLDGQVSVFISDTGIKVVDNGLGLEDKPRGYEGFGIGLKIVRDVCNKYGWSFRLQHNLHKGCTASVEFAPAAKSSE